MAVVNLNLSYLQLSELLQQEINKQKIVIKGYDIAISQLVINAENGKIRVTGMINSKWDASFDFSAVPFFRVTENKIYLEDLEFDLDSKNLIFKGILKLARGNVKSRIEKLVENPLDEQLLAAREMISKELIKAPLPYNLALKPDTKSITIRKLEALPEYLSLAAEIDLELNISFKEVPETIA